MADEVIGGAVGAGFVEVLPRGPEQGGTAPLAA
jgi:hypothetical protein